MKTTEHLPFERGEDPTIHNWSNFLTNTTDKR